MNEMFLIWLIELIWSLWLACHIWENKNDMQVVVICIIGFIPFINLFTGIAGFTVWFLETTKGFDHGTK